jgi:hypothetical protein
MALYYYCLKQIRNGSVDNGKFLLSSLAWRKIRPSKGKGNTHRAEKKLLTEVTVNV